jgi:hypothetical protein
MSDTPKLDLKIHSEDPEKFRVQMEESAELYWFYSNQLETAKSKVAQMKVELKTLEVRIANELRINDSKMSEARIERSLYDYPEYVEAMGRFNEIRFLEGKLGAVVRSLDVRHGLILSIAGMKKREARII